MTSLHEIPVTLAPIAERERDAIIGGVRFHVAGEQVQATIPRGTSPTALADAWARARVELGLPLPARGRPRGSGLGLELAEVEAGIARLRRNRFVLSQTNVATELGVSRNTVQRIVDRAGLDWRSDLLGISGHSERR